MPEPNQNSTLAIPPANHPKPPHYFDLAAEVERTARFAEAQHITQQNLEALHGLIRLLAAPHAPRLTLCDFSDEWCNCRERGTVHNRRSELDVCERHHLHIEREYELGRWTA